MELHNPTAKIASMANLPLVSIASETSTTDPTACTPNTLAGEKRVMTAAPMNRPTIAPPQ